MIVLITIIGIDTYSWKKLLNLKQSEWKPLINELILEGNYFITHEVKKELDHYFPNENEIYNSVSILPVLNELFQDFIIKNFDPADASLLEYNVIKGYKLITEDHPMLLEGITNQQNIIQLADYFAELYLIGFISSRELYHLVKILRKWKNITKKKEKQLLKFQRI